MTGQAEPIIAQLAALIAMLPAAYQADIAAAMARTAPVTLPPKPAPTAATARFDACIAVVLTNEGGFANNPNDAGGATNMGITHATLAAWRNADVSVTDVRNLTLAEARDVYRANYWLRNRCDQMPAGVDLAVLDFAVNSGGAIREIQRKLGVNPDGAVGPLTLAAMSLFDPADLIQKICTLRLDYLRQLDAWETFQKGWTRRVEAVRAKALAMAGG